MPVILSGAGRIGDMAVTRSYQPEATATALSFGRFAKG